MNKGMNEGMNERMNEGMKDRMNVFMFMFMPSDVFIFKLVLDVSLLFDSLYHGLS